MFDLCNAGKRFVLTIIFSMLLVFTLCFLAKTQITGAIIDSDAWFNLQTSFNLAKYNEFSRTKSQPTNYREPLTPLITAVWMKFNPLINLDYPLENFIEGEPARLVKLSNLFWLFLLLFGAFWSTYNLTNSLATSSFAVLLVYCFLPIYFDYLLTETPTAALLIWFSWSLVLTLKKNNPLAYFMVGIFGGGLVLTRAVFLYIVPIVFILTSQLLKIAQSSCLVKKMSITVLCFSIVVFPWMSRNYLKLNHFSVAERGGVVLYTRALKNTMTWMEIKGAFYAWAPWGKKQIGKRLGFSSKDLLEDGILERLNRKLPVSFYQLARSERVQLREFYEGKSIVNSNAQADKYQQREAVRMIVESPFRHVAMTPLFFWRGIPSIKPTSLKRYLSFMNDFPLGLILTLFYFGVGLWCFIKKHYKILLFCMPGSAMILFHSLFSHNIQRYNVPATSSMLVLLAVVCFIIIKRIRMRICTLR